MPKRTTTVTKKKPAAGGPKHAGGAPTKAPGGLGKVLYLRCTQDLLDWLDGVAANLRARQGVTLSRSDVARMILEERRRHEGD